MCLRPYSKVPYLIGSTSDDGTMFLPGAGLNMDILDEGLEPSHVTDMVNLVMEISEYPINAQIIRDAITYEYFPIADDKVRKSVYKTDRHVTVQFIRLADILFVDLRLYYFNEMVHVIHLLYFIIIIIATMEHHQYGYDYYIDLVLSVLQYPSLH